MDKWLLSFADCLDSYPLPPTGLPTLLSFHPGFLYLRRKTFAYDPPSEIRQTLGGRKVKALSPRTEVKTQRSENFRELGSSCISYTPSDFFLRLGSTPIPHTQIVPSLAAEKMSCHATQKEREGRRGRGRTGSRGYEDHKATLQPIHRERAGKG